ncbi:hypothetical protein BTW14_gp179 [BeAn 58058 virus]|uniref:hypothetical protein n=1 Tax=BeAn 58058 virus TaxID=67082 RepID=UPI00090C3C23|nr:hypothetical protein BTW14_gp179 [BeAn 58058 virus]APG58370.1 hypothetical protein BAV00194 [BeAn 58058 virus]
MKIHYILNIITFILFLNYAENTINNCKSETIIYTPIKESKNFNTIRVSCTSISASDIFSITYWLIDGKFPQIKEKHNKKN